MDRKLNIFAIYAREDKDVLFGLLHHLNSLNEILQVSIWHNDPIDPGQQWKPQIEWRLQNADVFLLLVSNAFMHSEFIKQLEFKMVIDRYKENKSVVIPIIIDACQWDIDFKSDDYDFNLNELQVLPERGKPIIDWDLPGRAYEHIAARVKRAVASFAGVPDQEGPKKEIGPNAKNDNSADQIETSPAEEREVERIAEKKKLHEDSEAEGEAEEEKRKGEEAEAAAQRKTEEKKRLLEESEAKRSTDKENRKREETEAAAHHEAEEKKRQLREAEAKRRAEAANIVKAEAADLRAKQERRLPKESESRRNSGTADRPNHGVESIENVEESQQAKNSITKKRVLTGSLVAILAIIGIWTYSVFNKDPEEQSPILPKIKATHEKDSSAFDKTKIDSQNREESFSKLGIGDTYEGGIIFEIDQASQTGKLAYPKDTGPMPWKDAMKIHERLGEGWRLATLDELEIMYRIIGQGATNSGQFAEELYWSATPYDDYQARVLRFRDGNTSYHYNSGGTHRKFLVRAVRDFSR